MEFNQQDNLQNSIISIENTQILLAHTHLKTPCFVSTNYHTQTQLSDLKLLDKPTLFPLINRDEISLLIIGTGERTQFLSPKQQIDLQQMGLNVESMTTRSACVSFNVLLSEARSVGLLLL